MREGAGAVGHSQRLAPSVSKERRGGRGGCPSIEPIFCQGLHFYLTPKGEGREGGVGKFQPGRRACQRRQLGRHRPTQEQRLPTRRSPAVFTDRLPRAAMADEHVRAVSDFLESLGELRGLRVPDAPPRSPPDNRRIAQRIHHALAPDAAATQLQARSTAAGRMERSPSTSQSDIDALAHELGLDPELPLSPSGASASSSEPRSNRVSWDVSVTSPARRRVPQPMQFGPEPTPLPPAPMPAPAPRQLPPPPMQPPTTAAAAMRSPLPSPAGHSPALAPPQPLSPARLPPSPSRALVNPGLEAAAMALPAAAHAAASSASWDLGELAFVPTLPLPAEWTRVHDLRRARQLVVDHLLPGREQLASCMQRAREAEIEAERQREIAAQQQKVYDRRHGGGAATLGSGVVGGKSTFPLGGVQGGAGADGSAFRYVLAHGVAKKTLMRTALLALALQSATSRLQRCAQARALHRHRPRNARPRSSSLIAIVRAPADRSSPTLSCLVALRSCVSSLKASSQRALSPYPGGSSLPPPPQSPTRSAWISRCARGIAEQRTDRSCCGWAALGTST